MKANFDDCSKSVNIADGINYQYMAVKSYSAKFPTKPKSFILRGSFNNICWFILDSYEGGKMIFQDQFYSISRNIRNSTYLKYFQIEAEYPGEESQKSEKIILELNGDVCNGTIIAGMGKLPESDQTDGIQVIQPPGIIQHFIYSNFQVFITTNPADEKIPSPDLNYSEFSKYISHTSNLHSLDPYPQGEYEFRFQSLSIQFTEIFFRCPIPNNCNFKIYGLTKDDCWIDLVQITSQAHNFPDDFPSIYGLRFDTSIFSFKDFDFHGTIELPFTKLVPSRFTSFPCLDDRLGILSALLNFTSVHPSMSGLYRLYGQINPTDGSQNSFIRNDLTYFVESPENKVVLTFAFKFRIFLSSYTIVVPTRDRNERFRNPHTWELWGSNDGETWEQLDRVENCTDFDTDCTEKTYQVKTVSNSYSMFQFRKFQTHPINQIALRGFEFYGLVEPCYGPPDFFWNTEASLNNVAPSNDFDIYAAFKPDNPIEIIRPLDLCNGILGSLNYYNGKSFNQTSTEFIFEKFAVHLKSIAVVNCPNDLSIQCYDSLGNEASITFKNAYVLHGNIAYLSFNDLIKDIQKIKLSAPTDGIEFFGAVSNTDFKSNEIRPRESLQIPFNLHYKKGILESLLSAQSPDDITIYASNHELFSIQASKKLPLLLEHKEIESNEPFLIIDFIDMDVTVSQFCVITDKLKAIQLYGSNDNENFELLFSLEQSETKVSQFIHFFEVNSKRKYRYLTVTKTDPYRVINFIDFYGTIELSARPRQPVSLDSFNGVYVASGLSYDNGIINALQNKNFPLRKYHENGYLVFDFYEISVLITMFTFLPIKSNETFILDGKNDKTDEWVQLYHDQLNKDSYKLDSKIFVNSIRIKSDYQIENLEIFGVFLPIAHHATPKKPPEIKYYLNPFNGILNSKNVKYQLSKSKYYTLIEFDQSICIKPLIFFCLFTNGTNFDCFSECSIDGINWETLESFLQLSGKTCVVFDFATNRIFRFFRMYYYTDSIGIDQMDIFGSVIPNTYQEEAKESQFSLGQPMHVRFQDDFKRNGIFYHMQLFYCDPSYGVNTNGTIGCYEENSNCLLDYKTQKILTFPGKDNVIQINIILGKIKLESYVIPIVFQRYKNLQNWSLFGSEDGKNYTKMHEITDRSLEQTVFHLENESRAYSSFRLVSDDCFILRNIEFYGEFIPSEPDDNLLRKVIIDSNEIRPQTKEFSGLFAAMNRYTNVFEREIVTTQPQQLARLLIMNSPYSHKLKRKSDSFISNDSYDEFPLSNIPSVPITENVTITFHHALIHLTFYSIDTTMKKWEIQYSNLDSWTTICQHSQHSTCHIYAVPQCPLARSIRIVNLDEPNKEIHRLEFFGSVQDLMPSSIYRFDIFKGILNSTKQVYVTSSAFKHTNPMQLLDRRHLGRVFTFIPDPHEAFVMFTFMYDEVEIDQFAMIFSENPTFESHLRLEGGFIANNEINWEEINVINHQTYQKTLLFRNSNSKHFYRYLRFISEKEFTFENIEFFGNKKAARPLTLPLASNAQSMNILYDESEVLGKFLYHDSLNGFFHNPETVIDGFVDLSCSRLDSSSKQLDTIFTSDHSSILFDSTKPFIRIDFKTVAFQLTHFLIHSSEKITVKVVCGRHLKKIFGQTINNKCQQIKLTQPSSSFIFYFTLPNQSVTLTYFEIFGLVVPKDIHPIPLLNLGSNNFGLKNRNGTVINRKTRNLSAFGIIRSICLNSNRELKDNGILTITETDINHDQIPVLLKKGTRFSYNYRNSPQVTFQFGDNKVSLQAYSIKGMSSNWIVDVSRDGEVWFTIDHRIKKGKSDEMYVLQKPVDEVSFIRITDYSSLFESVNLSKHQKLFKNIEFFGDLILNQEVVENETILSIDTIDDINATNNDIFNPQTNLIYFPTNFTKLGSINVEHRKKEKVAKKETIPEYEYEYEYEPESDEGEGEGDQSSLMDFLIALLEIGRQNRTENDDDDD